MVRVQRRQQPDGKLQILVRAEGPTRVLSITDLEVTFSPFELPQLGPALQDTPCIVSQGRVQFVWIQWAFVSMALLKGNEANKYSI